MLLFEGGAKTAGKQSWISRTPSSPTRAARLTFPLPEPRGLTVQKEGGIAVPYR